MLKTMRQIAGTPEINRSRPPRVGRFRPVDLHDANRQHLKDDLFLAVDREDTNFHDDGILAKPSDGGFLMGTAVADVSQIPENSRLILNSILWWAESLEGERMPYPALPGKVSRQLSLGTGEHNVIFISRSFDDDRYQPRSEAYITPAKVRVQPLTHKRFGQKAKKDFCQGNKNLFVDYHEAVNLRMANRPDYIPDAKYFSSERLGRRILRTWMINACINAASWAVQNEVTLLFSKDPVDWEPQRKKDENGIGRSILPAYTTEPVGFSVAEKYSGEAGVPYASVTSPLRRAADLVNILQISSAKKGKPFFSRHDLDYIAEYISPTEEELGATLQEAA